MDSSIEDAHILQTLSVHRNDVNSVDFAADCTLVTGSGDKSVRVWKWHQGSGYEQVSWSPLMGHKYGVTCVKVSPQSTMLASASIDGTTQLWNLRTGSKIHTLVQTGGEAVRVCRFAPDSTLLVTAGDNGQICLWDLIRRNLIRSLQAHEGAVQGVAFSPDSNWLITTCTLGVLKLFSSFEIVDSSGSQSFDQSINVFATVDDAHDLGVVCCDFSTCQTITNDRIIEKTYQLVTCGNDHDVKLWDVRVAEGKTQTQPITASISLVRVFEKHSSALTCVRFSSNGTYIVSSGLDKIAVIWETNTGKIVSVLRAHKRYLACCAFSRDGNVLATGSNDRSVIVWDLTGNNLTLDSKLVRQPAALSQSANDNQDNDPANQEQKFVNYAESSGNDVTLIATLDDHGGAVNSVAFYGNNLLASGSGDKLVRLWSGEREEEIIDTEDGEQITHVELKFVDKSFSPIDGHKYSVNYVEFSPCGSMLASCSLDGTTMIWCTENGEEARGSFVNSGTGIRVCRWSPDGTKIATAGDDEKTTIWDINTMEELQNFECRILEGHADAVTAVAFTPDSNYIITACSEGTWRIFEIFGDSNALTVCDAHDLGVQGCDFSPATSSPFTPGSHQPPTNEEGCKSFTLASCGNDSLVKLWQIKILKKDKSDNNESEDEEGSNANPLVTFREKRVLTGHGGNVMDVKFAPFHGEIIGSVATDRTARIWSVNSGMCLFVLEYHESLVTCCAFSGDTALFATGALDKTVAIWRLPQQLISQSILIDQLRNNRKNIIDWKTEDIVKWLIEVDLGALESRFAASRLNGRLLLTLPEEVIIARLGLMDYPNVIKSFRNQLYWLKQQDINTSNGIDEDTEVPDEYLCPITHEIMREPVKCSDGFVYEKAAINEWFLCGKYTSPMTNESLNDTSITPAIALRNAICTFLHGERSDD
ncbi:WD repeat, SAM and U-box domain-containing protein 1-like isoform X2 [Microplitis mediator]|uniref:WD repeat, SAM and U-box domain-containing protein 1-like isoform X2 n=1 Tax=Microplitis mediator TaxID=375433 RepID=UPI0025521F2E|nr:WD repeat, SAM and U-box domain-containing protein 1-like isoform X2 [Microplitis mediator]